jgi:hypothetical protein
VKHGGGKLDNAEPDAAVGVPWVGIEEGVGGEVPAAKLKHGFHLGNAAGGAVEHTFKGRYVS